MMLNDIYPFLTPPLSLLDRPSLLSRHLALASQTNSLTSFLSLANPNTFTAQVSDFNEALTAEALQHNKFSLRDGAAAASAPTTSNDALFSGSKVGQDETKTDEEFKLAKVQYTDENNALRHLAPHPFYPLEMEKAQLALPPLLLPRPDEGVIAEEEKRWKSWASLNGLPDRPPGSRLAGEDSHWIELIRNQIREHDEFAGQAIRSFVHAREATDEMGQRYDWKMRLSLEEASDDEEGDDEGEGEGEGEGNGDTQGQEGDGEQGRKRKRDQDQESTLSLQQVSTFLSTGEL